MNHFYFFYSRQNKLRRISRKQRVEIRDSTIQYCMNKNHSKTTYFKVLCTRYLIFSTMYSAKKNHKLILLFAKSSSWNKVCALAESKNTSKNMKITWTFLFLQIKIILTSSSLDWRLSTGAVCAFLKSYLTKYQSATHFT